VQRNLFEKYGFRMNTFAGNFFTIGTQAPIKESLSRSSSTRLRYLEHDDLDKSETTVVLVLSTLVLWRAIPTTDRVTRLGKAPANVPAHPGGMLGKTKTAVALAYPGGILGEPKGKGRAKV
jgi:hypothetical protein